MYLPLIVLMNNILEVITPTQEQIHEQSFQEPSFWDYFCKYPHFAGHIFRYFMEKNDLELWVLIG